MKKNDGRSKIKLPMEMLFIIFMVVISIYIFWASSFFYTFVNEIVKSTLNITITVGLIYVLGCILFLIILLFLMYFVHKTITRLSLQNHSIKKISQKEPYKNVLTFLKKITKPYAVLTIIAIAVCLMFGLYIYGQYYENDLPKTLTLVGPISETTAPSSYTVECYSLNHNYHYLVQGDVLECEYKNIAGAYEVHAYVYNSDFSIVRSLEYKYTIGENDKVIPINLTDPSIRGIIFGMSLNSSTNQSQSYTTYLMQTKIISQDNAENKENQKLTALFAIISLSIISVIIAVKNLKDIIEN
jgi:hypothetical protein